MICEVSVFLFCTNDTYILCIIMLDPRFLTDSLETIQTHT